MTVTYLEHVNMRTANLEAMCRFYEDVLGMARGARPPFPSAGAWLYCADKPAVHLVAVTGPTEGHGFGIDHFAFRAQGLAAFLERLEARGLAHRLCVVPGLDIRQVFLEDPDGNHVEVIFGADEETDLSGAYRYEDTEPA